MITTDAEQHSFSRFQVCYGLRHRSDRHVPTLCPSILPPVVFQVTWLLALHWSFAGGWLQFLLCCRKNTHWLHVRQTWTLELSFRHPHAERSQYAVSVADLILIGTLGRLRGSQWYGKRWFLQCYAYRRFERLRQRAGIRCNGRCRHKLDWWLPHGRTYRRIPTRCIRWRDCRVQSLQASNLLRWRPSAALRIACGLSPFANVKESSEETVRG